jgi:hypothetical protein
LDGSAGMLLFPEGNERRLDPMAQRAEAVDAGMAGGAQSNQEARLMDPGSAVMDRQFMGRPTAAAAAAVALQNLGAAPGEAAAGMPILPVAAGAQSAAKQPEAAAGAEKPGLPTAQGRDARW